MRVRSNVVARVVVEDLPAAPVSRSRQGRLDAQISVKTDDDRTTAELWHPVFRRVEDFSTDDIMPAENFPEASEEFRSQKARNILHDKELRPNAPDQLAVVSKQLVARIVLIS